MSLFGTPLFDWFLFFFIIAICVTSIWAFYFWWKKDRHTRERFAFMGFFTLVGFGSLYLTSLTVGNSFLGGLITNNI